MAGQKDVVRNGVLSCFNRVLEADQDARRVAEEELKTLEVTEEFGVVLAEMTASKNDPVQCRQLASIVLKQYIESHWSTSSEKFEEPEVTEQSKLLIREILPSCLGDCHSKVRAAVAYAISSIAKWDWPEDWPSLFDQLVCFLQSGEPNVVHGTMRVLNEFCQSVLDSQLPHVAHAVLPHLLKIIVQADLFSVHTRTRAVHIYNVLSGLIFSLTMSYPESTKLLLYPTLEQYLHAFVNILSSDLPSNSDHGLRKEVIMTLCHLLQYCTQPLSAHVMSVVTPVWDILTQQTTVYLNSVVNSEQWLDETCDSDGEVIGQESSIFAVFEFISMLGESDSYQTLLPPILPQLMYLLLVYLQITEHQASCWLENVNQFVDEDENELSYSVRLSAFDLVKVFIEDPNLADASYSSITFAVKKHLEENALNSSPHWWKVHEACLLLCSVLVEPIKQQELEFDVLDFMEQVLLPDIRANASPLLTGRCLWLAGKMSSLLPASLLPHLLEVVSEALGASDKPLLRVLASKALYYFCDELKSTEHAHMLKSWLPGYLTSLCELATHSSEDVIFLLVDTLQLVSRMDVEATGQCSSNIVPLAMSLFLHYSHDPGISSCVEELFEALAPNPCCHVCLHSHIVPTALDILGSVSLQLPQGLVAGMLEVLAHVVRGCVAGDSARVPPPFIQEIFPVATKKILDSSDSAVLQNGGECVRAFVSADIQQLAAWCDPTGCNGLQYVIKVILHLLDPLMPEYSASFVGKLILVFIRKAGSAVGQDLQLVLRAVLSKMQSTNTCNVMQSLLLVFAYLVHTEMEETISFLSQVPDLSGQPALQYVLTQWSSRHSSFFGVYDSKVSTLAFCQLLSHCVATGDQRLLELKVKCHTHTGRMEDIGKWVPVPVEILKLLIYDLEKAVGISPEAEEYGDEPTLEQLLAMAEGSEDWQPPVDPDVRDDPILEVDIKTHLTKFLQELAQQPCFHSMSTYLIQSEQNFLSSLINTQ